MTMFLISIFLGYLGFGALLYIYQRSFIYHPTPKIASNLPNTVIHSGGEQIRVLIGNAGRSHAIIYFGGNDEQVAKIANGFQILFPGYTIYLVNYRGYSGSTGTPTEAALYQDALAVYDQFYARHRGISVIGRSLGSGVATYLAAKRIVQRLVLVTPFDSVERIAQSQYPIYPIFLMLKDKFNSVRWARKITAPTLILLAEHDTVTPHQNSQRLANAFAPRLVSVWIMPGTTHSRLNISGSYGEALQAFLGASPSSHWA